MLSPEGGLLPHHTEGVKKRPCEFPQQREWSKTEERGKPTFRTDHIPLGGTDFKLHQHSILFGTSLRKLNLL